ncbi:universal stress protein [Halegenticoccus tardaugens]|uniref:universal stress protein n=1 Tax=Halegenticoccus tardaugens TaxID=2071624 RepID=UPI00100B326B|nr:universal stress protein [Halegenticoccus tardaugens]
MYGNILIPTDGSRAMASAIEQCFHQAELNEATIHALYVVDIRAYMRLPEKIQKQVIHVQEQEGAHALEYFDDRATASEIEIVTEIRHGIPYEVILDYANTNGIDLIFMGTHGRTGEEKRILGSIAEEVVCHASIPVLTVHMRVEDVERLEEDISEEQRRYIT